MYEKLKVGDVLYYADAQLNIKTAKVLMINKERDSFLTENRTCYKTELGSRFFYDKSIVEKQIEELNKVLDMFRVISLSGEASEAAALMKRYCDIREGGF